MIELRGREREMRLQYIYKSSDLWVGKWFEGRMEGFWVGPDGVGRHMVWRHRKGDDWEHGLYMGGKSGIVPRP